MDATFDAAHDAFHQRFHTLTAQIQALQKEWHEAVRTQNHARQLVVLSQEHALLTDMHTMIAAFQAHVAERHHWGGSAREVEAADKDTRYPAHSMSSRDQQERHM
jgi:hypothetical protein